jgi:hypothetical protein
VKLLRQFQCLQQLSCYHKVIPIAASAFEISYDLPLAGNVKLTFDDGLFKVSDRPHSVPFMDSTSG